MPTLDELETLKTLINRLGDESRIRKERGESIEDIRPPEPALDSDLDLLLADDLFSSEQSDSAEEYSEGGADEMEALLGDFTDDMAETDTDSDMDNDFVLDEIVPGEELSPDIDGTNELTEEGADSISLEELADFGDLDAAAAELDGLEGSSDESPDTRISDSPAASEPGNAEPGIDEFNIDDLDISESPDNELGGLEPESTDFDSLDSLEPESADFDNLGGLEPESTDLDGLDSFEPDSTDLDSLVPDSADLDSLGGLEPDSTDFDSLDSFEPDSTDLDSLGDLEPDSTDLDGLGSLEPDSADLDAGTGSVPADESTLDIGDIDGGEDFGLDGIGDDELNEEQAAASTDDNLGASDEDFGNLDEVPDVDDESESSEPPDMKQTLEGLEAGEDDEELTLDEELNFDDELGADLISDLRDFDTDTQQFSMDDFGDQYNFNDNDADLSGGLGVNLEDLEQSLDDAMVEGTVKPFAVSEDDFAEIRKTLAGLPRNLKLAIEEILADERRSPEDLRPLVDSLISGDSPKALVSRVKSITKRKIVLPRGYEKRSGLSLVRRREALVYRLVNEGWPVLRVILLVISISWVTAAAVFMWVYRPIKAGMLYDQGLEEISLDNIESANRYFFDAWDGWPLFVPENNGGQRIEDAPVIVKGWKQNSRWLDYARSLRRRKHWSDAENYYKGYLALKPDSKDIRLEYSSFLSKVLGKYEQAIRILENGRSISGRDNDRDYLLGEGDVYLDWAEDDASRYEMARLRYAKVVETSRNDERAYLSMMRYQLRLANDTEIMRLLPVFDSEIPGKTDVPALAAEVYAGLADFHLQRGSRPEARRFLDLALSADPTAPEPPYIDAAYWKTQGDESRELRSYKRTLVNLEGRESLSRQDLQMRIMSLGGMGRINAQRWQRFRSESPEDAAESGSLALNNYTKALNLYEDAVDRNQLGASSQYGSLYTELGDLYFNGSSSPRDLEFSLVPLDEILSAGANRETELRLAIDYYNKAEQLFSRGVSGSRLPVNVLYRRAYANYILGNQNALVDFHRVVRLRPEDYEARFSLATSLLQSGDYEASRSQYARTIDLLDDELSRTGGRLMPFERPGHTDLLLRYVAGWNNLGVGRARSAERGGGEDDYAAALGAFTTASEYLDMVNSDMDTLAGSRGIVALRDTEDRRIWDDNTGTGERNDRREISTHPYQNRLRLLGLSSSDVSSEEYLVYPDIPSALR